MVIIWLQSISIDKNHYKKYYLFHETWSIKKFSFV